MQNDIMVKFYLYLKKDIYAVCVYIIYMCMCICAYVYKCLYIYIYAYNCIENIYKDTQKLSALITTREKYWGDLGLLHFISYCIIYFYNYTHLLNKKEYLYILKYKTLVHTFLQCSFF